MNRHRFVTFHNRGFPFLLGPLRTTTKIEFGVCKKFENVLVTNFFFVFATLFTSEINEIFRITRNVWKLTEFTFSSSGAL